MHRSLRAISFLVSILVSSSCAPRKKLIEFGWDIPDTTFMMHNITAMERTPFDGCVFTVKYVRPDGRRGSFTWEAWGARAFDAADLHPAARELEFTRLNRFRHNFLRINVTPGRIDWFDDYAAILTNARWAARLARIGRARGVLLDVEQYDGRLFDYRPQRDARTKSYREYAAQARLRGFEVMRAFEGEYPGLTVFLTFGHSLTWHMSVAGARSLANTYYGLLAPFLDGMLDAAGRDARIVDGFELSYGYRDAHSFTRARQFVLEETAALAADPAKYRRQVKLAFGLWLDYGGSLRDFSDTRPETNYFSPLRFELCVAKALETSDEYVWIYSQKPRWWNGPPPPAPYVEALRRVRGERRRRE